MTWIARRRFTAQYGSERVVIERGEQLVDDHEIARKYPSEFDHRDDPADPAFAAAALRITSKQNGRAPVRSAPRGGRSPRRRLTAEQQGAIRRRRLAELQQREAEGWRATPEAHRDAVSVFWRGVDALLERTDPQLARERQEDREGAALMNALDDQRQRMLAADREDLSEWLDR